MKKYIFLLSILGMLSFDMDAQHYKVITTVESIVPMGLGRSRIIDHTESQDVSSATTQRIDGKDSNQGRVRRKDLKIDNLNETKLLNFYSGVGINFQNIASNDAMISAKINEMVEAGWELTYVTSGVESESGKGDGQGIFITRYIFMKK